MKKQDAGHRTQDIETARLRKWVGFVLLGAWGLALVSGGAKAGVPLRIVEVLTLGALAAWLFRGGGLPKGPWTAPLAGFCLWLPVNLLSPGPAVPRLEALNHVAALLAFFIAARAVWGREERRFFELSIFAAAIVSAVFIPLQARAGESLVGFLPDNPNFSAGLLVAAILLGLPRLKERPALHGSLLFFFLYALSLQKSRGAWLALAAGALFLAHSWRGARAAAAAGGALVLWGLAIPGNYFYDLSKLHEGFSGLARLDLWESALEVIGAEPMTGWGAGQFERGFLLHPTAHPEALFRYERLTRFAHSGPLQIAAEMGLPSLFFLSWAVWRLWRSAREPIALRAAFLACLVQGSVDMAFSFPLLQLLWLGLAAGLEPAEVPRPAPRAAGSLKAAAVALAALFAGAGPLMARAGLLSDPREPARRAAALHDEGRPPAGSETRRAEGNHRRALALDPGNAWLWQEWAHFLAWHTPPSRWGEALFAYDQAKALNPFHAPLFLLAGELAFAHHDAVRAEHEFRACIKLEPRALAAWRGLERALDAQGRKSEARRLRLALKALERRIREVRVAPRSNYARSLLGFVL